MYLQLLTPLLRGHLGQLALGFVIGIGAIGIGFVIGIGAIGIGFVIGIGGQLALGL